MSPELNSAIKEFQEAQRAANIADMAFEAAKEYTHKLAVEGTLAHERLLAATRLLRERAELEKCE